ncbi:SHOCT domain-containing protein [Anaerobutyricum hallii]|uniref:SHOCT domain-containing protein n=1 Tax=Anaerobutyricum hallii TaxID=39488 RepID=UPI00351F968D
MVYKEQEAQKVNKELEYTKKITLIAKLYRKNLLTEKEYEKIRRKLQNNYLII